MLSRIRPRLNHPTVVAYVALFVALGSGSYAAVKINGRDIKNRSIAGKKLEDRTITRGKVQKNALTGTEINESRLGKVPNSARSDAAATAERAKTADTATTAGAATSASNSNLLDGLDATDFLQVASGQTIRGAFEMNQDGGTGSGQLAETAVGFPVSAHLTDANQVNFAPAPGFPTLTTDTDSSCTGAEDNPTAPPGKVCLYAGQPNNVTDASGFPGGVTATFLYFQIDAKRASGTGAYSLEGTWAYTVP
jgi:hypothetical protein